MRALQAGMMQRLSESVLPAFPSRVLCSVITSLCRDSGSSTAHQVLDQLFPRSHLPSVPGDALIPFGTHGGSLAHCVRDAGGQDHLPNAIYFLLGTWLGQGQDCREPLRFSLGPCSWPLCTSALVAPTWRAMPTFCQATWSISRPLRPNGKELFKTLVPAHCLGSIWSERDNRERESLAPTVRDTVMHDNTVANCILVTCLGDASMTAQDRARVVELWIRVAESPAIARLQDTWGQVSRESSRTWKKWVRREKRVSRELLVQEATSMLKTAERARQGAQERQWQQGVVPSLVTFFRSLELLDATMEDYVEGNVLNCRKWNEVSGCGLLVGRVGVWKSETPPAVGRTPSGPIPRVEHLFAQFDIQS
nr:ral guanine nucleotide dissociation stimulator-like isoform X3 [Equus caballus]